MRLRLVGWVTIMLLLELGERLLHRFATVWIGAFAHAIASRRIKKNQY
jgi:hypothetical protein